jgi:hypothetical protein
MSKKYKVEIQTWVSKVIEVEAESPDAIEDVALFETDGNYDGIDFNMLEAGEFEVIGVEETA